MGREEDAIDTYVRSSEINDDDHELLYNMAMKMGDRGDTEKEREYYRHCLSVKGDYGQRI